MFKTLFLSFALAGTLLGQIVRFITPSTTVYASKIPGVVLDCNLSTGLTATGGACTDNTAAINQILNRATAAAAVNLILDGGSLTTGIHIPRSGHVTIDGIGWDSGFFVGSGSNSAAISNGYGVSPSGAIPGRGANIILKNFRINGNIGPFPSGNSSVTDARGNPWITGIQIFGIDGLVLDNVWVYNAPTFQILVGNVGHFVARNLRLETSTTSSSNTDGIHIDGPAENISSDGCTFGNLNADAIALNPTALATVASGGAVTVSVSCDGRGWIVQ